MTESSVVTTTVAVASSSTTTVKKIVDKANDSTDYDEISEYLLDAVCIIAEYLELKDLNRLCFAFPSIRIQLQKTEARQHHIFRRDFENLKNELMDRINDERCVNAFTANVETISMSIFIDLLKLQKVGTQTSIIANTPNIYNNDNLQLTSQIITYLMADFAFQSESKPMNFIYEQLPDFYASLQILQNENENLPLIKLFPQSEKQEIYGYTVPRPTLSDDKKQWLSWGTSLKLFNCECKLFHFNGDNRPKNYEKNYEIKEKKEEKYENYDDIPNIDTNIVANNANNPKKFFLSDLIQHLCQLLRKRGFYSHGGGGSDGCHNQSWFYNIIEGIIECLMVPAIHPPNLCIVFAFDMSVVLWYIPNNIDETIIIQWILGKPRPNRGESENQGNFNTHEEYVHRNRHNRQRNRDRDRNTAYNGALNEDEALRMALQASMTAAATFANDVNNGNNSNNNSVHDTDNTNVVVSDDNVNNGNNNGGGSGSNGGDNNNNDGNNGNSGNNNNNNFDIGDFGDQDLLLALQLSMEAHQQQ